jgi:hypothetical protein
MADGPHSRETRDFAREVKFLVDGSLHSKILDWQRANLQADANGAGPHADEYRTASLYFETDDFLVYHKTRSYGRSKFRVRRYGTMDIVFLERKFRTDRLLAKRRTIVPLPELEHLAGESPDRAWAGYWFHRRVLLRRLKPLIQMSYDRVARVGQSENGPVRMTVDTNLRVLPLPDRALIPGVGLPLIPDKTIIEIKYRVAMPALFRQFCEAFGIEPSKTSKYRLGLSALDYAPAPPPKDPPGSAPPR